MHKALSASALPVSIFNFSFAGHFVFSFALLVIPQLVWASNYLKLEQSCRFSSKLVVDFSAVINEHTERVIRVRYSERDPSKPTAPPIPGIWEVDPNKRRIDYVGVPYLYNFGSYRPFQWNGRPSFYLQAKVLVLTSTSLREQVFDLNYDSKTRQSYARLHGDRGFEQAQSCAPLKMSQLIGINETAEIQQAQTDLMNIKRKVWQTFAKRMGLPSGVESKIRCTTLSDHYYHGTSSGRRPVDIRVHFDKNRLPKGLSVASDALASGDPISSTDRSQLIYKFGFDERNQGWPFGDTEVRIFGLLKSKINGRFNRVWTFSESSSEYSGLEFSPYENSPKEFAYRFEDHDLYDDGILLTGVKFSCSRVGGAI